MPRIIFKCPYIKPGAQAAAAHRKHYVRYVATRDGVELLNRSGQYMEYIANRPRSHGLFSNVQNTNLEETMQEVNVYPAPV